MPEWVQTITSSSVILLAAALVYRSKFLKIQLGDWKAVIENNNKVTEESITTLQQIRQDLQMLQTKILNHEERISVLERYEKLKQEVMQDNQ